MALVSFTSSLGDCIVLQCTANVRENAVQGLVVMHDNMPFDCSNLYVRTEDDYESLAALLTAQALHIYREKKHGAGKVD